MGVCMSWGWAQHAHDKEKLGIFPTSGNILAYTDHTTSHTVGQRHVSPHPHPPSHPRPRIVTSTPQRLLVQPTQGILVRQPISCLQQVCFTRDSTPSTNRGHTWQCLLSLHLFLWHRGHRRRSKEVQSISPTRKWPVRGPQCITIAPKGVPFLSDMHNNTHKCTRNEGKACKQLI